MTEAAKLREQAERCRRLAASATEQIFARVLMGLADEFAERAERLERQERQATTLSQAPPSTPEQQPMQQQQQVQPKKEDE